MTNRFIATLAVAGSIGVASSAANAQSELCFQASGLYKLTYTQLGPGQISGAGFRIGLGATPVDGSAYIDPLSGRLIIGLDEQYIWGPALGRNWIHPAGTTVIDWTIERYYTTYHGSDETPPLTFTGPVIEFPCEEIAGAGSAAVATEMLQGFDDPNAAN